MPSSAEGVSVIKTVAIDFDGVIHDYEGGWQGYDVISGNPVPGVIEDILRLKAAGYTVIVMTSRALSLFGLSAVKSWLEERGLTVGNGSFEPSGLGNSFDIFEVTSSKVPAMCYIDDRGVTFRPGMDLLETVRNFTPWMNDKPIESALE